MSRTIISVPVTDELKRALMTRAAELDRPLSWVARRALEAWLASGCSERPGIGQGAKDALTARSIPDTSADELLGPPTAAEWEAKLAAESGVNSVMRGGAKPQRLAVGRALLSGAKERRGFETRVTPNGLRLDVPIPGESYVDEND